MSLVDEASSDQPASVTFLMRNTTAQTIYLTRNDSFHYWALRLDGVSVQATQGCASCICDQESCAVCGAQLPEVVELAAGEEKSFVWDGVLWNDEPDTIRGSGACIRAQGATAGEGYQVEIPYSASFEEVEQGRVLADPMLKTLGFEYPPEDQEPLLIEF